MQEKKFPYSDTPFHFQRKNLLSKVLYVNQIISEKTFDRITDWDNEKDKEKDDYER